MLPKSPEINFALLKYLEDGEVHTLRSSTLYLQKYFNLTDEEKNDFNPKRKSPKKDYVNTPSTKFYKKVVDAISVLRKTKYLEDFPNTDDDGVFLISDDGLNLLLKSRAGIQKSINTRYSSYLKNKK